MRVTLDGTQYEPPEHGGTIYETLSAVGITVPTLCHDPRLKPRSVCRMCIVEVEGTPHPVPSCATALVDGMVVRTRSQHLDQDQTSTLRLLAQRHPPDVLEDRAARPFAGYLRAFGLTGALARPGTRAPRSSSAYIFMNETAREYAHVVLPSACGFEKDGTYMNAERRVQRVRQAVPAPGDARPDWAAPCDVARALGHARGFGFESAEEIWEEIRKVWPAGRGITYARLERGGLQWPCPTEDHPGTTLLHTDAFGSSRRAALCRIEHTPTEERTTDELPFVLNTGRSLHHFNAGTMTLRTKNRVLRPSDRLDMCAGDAARLSLAEGDRVRVSSRHGAALLPLHVDDAVSEGELFATFSDPVTGLNALIGSVRDKHTETPEYKLTAVRVEKA